MVFFSDPQRIWVDKRGDRRRYWGICGKNKNAAYEFVWEFWCNDRGKYTEIYLDLN